jgi:hypothetical protein
MVKLFDPKRGVLAPPKDSVMKFKIGWGGSMASEPVPVFIRKGSFPFKKLLTEIQLKVIEVVLERHGGESWNVWESSRHVQSLCERIETARNICYGIEGF